MEAAAAAEGAMTPNNAEGAGYAAGSPDEAGGELGTAAAGRVVRGALEERQVPLRGLLLSN